MKIISPFHDYYDSVMALGQDAARVYVRTTTFPAKHPLERVQSALKDVWPVRSFVASTSFSPGYAEAQGRQLYARTTQVTDFLVLVGGVAYPGLRLDVPGQPPQFFYEAAAATEGCLATGILSTEKRNRWWDPKPDENRIKALFTLSKSNQFQAVCAESNTALALVTVADICLNPHLGAIRFFQVLTAWELFQALEMFIGGIASSDEKAMTRISDSDRLTQHGFDRHSFRRPSTKKSRPGKGPA